MDPPTTVGLANAVLRAIGLPAQPWVYSPTEVIPSLALMSLWGVGRSMVIFLAALQGLPPDVLEAAAWTALVHLPACST
ncbi:MAG: hypothetical protein M3069_01100 [Chloroflexota bacterium]|nr:hypothetical protein [Chloroflexota bacterium]